MRFRPPEPNEPTLGDWDLVYDLGPARGFLALGRDFLVIRIGSSGSAAVSRIMTDG
ncbi:MAG: hypothetical protein ACI85K_003330 [Hyphomicrobiaceae bacterium]|jgi:hypothetical protein